METEVNDEELQCKVKKVVLASKLITPVLLNIDNRSVTAAELTGCDCRWYEDGTDRSSRVVSFVNSDKDNYEGTAKLTANLSKTMLVIQNKKTNKVQLIEVSECRLGRVLKQPSLQSNYDNDEMATTYEDNRSKLLKAFGSKKSNRASDIGSKMKINNNVMSSQIKHTAADVTVDVKELELADSSVDTCLPTIHRDATTAASVYCLEDFVTQEELDSMEDEAFTILNLMPFTEEESGYSQLFLNLLERLQNRTNLENIKVLLVVDALLKFINWKVFKKIKAKKLTETVSPYSAKVTKKIIENFTVESTEGRARNVTMEDKIVIHIIVLTIIACESCDTDELAKFLPRFSVRKIGQIARALCLSTRDKITWFVKLPLPPPKTAFLRRRT